MDNSVNKKADKAVETKTKATGAKARARPSRAAAKPEELLVGKWFHTRREGRIRFQGRIDAHVGAGYYLVQLFDWVVGDPSVKRVSSIMDMEDWDFYNSSEEMNEAWEYEEGHKSDIEMQVD